MVDIIKRFEKNKEGQTVFYKIVSLRVTENGDVYLTFRFGVPKSDKKEEYVFKLDFGEMVLIEEILREARKKAVENKLNEKLIKKDKE